MGNEQIIKTGLSSVLSPKNTDNNSSVQIIAARVKAIILDETIDKILGDKGLFERLGGWNSLGTIFFSEMEKVVKNEDIKSLPIARPLYPQYKYYPLINEPIYIISLPVPNTQNIPTLNEYYYIDVINVWNSPHHNALPSNEDTNNAEGDYVNSPKGSFRRINDGSSDIKLGQTFKEKSTIQTLLPFEGDFILESRFGSSIRFGSTVLKSKNNWSGTGNEGDPITIIRNGQSNNESGKGWIPTLEDINKDDSSIYITSNQVIPIEVSCLNQDSFNIKNNKVSNQSVQLVDTPIIEETQKPSSDIENIPEQEKNISNQPLIDKTTNIQSTDNTEEFFIEDNLSFETIDSAEQNSIKSTEDDDFKDEKDNNSEYQYYYDIVHQTQAKNSTDCFVVASSMLLSWYNIIYTPSSIKTNYVKGGLLDSRNLFKDKLKKTITPQSISGGNTGYNQIISAIKQYQRPFILCRKGTSGGTHFVVISGLNKNNQIIQNNPGKLAGKKDILVPENLLSNGGSIRIIQ